MIDTNGKKIIEKELENDKKIFALFVLMSLTFILSQENYKQPLVVVSFDRSMSMVRNFSGYPERDQMSASDFVRVNNFLITLINEGYYPATNKLAEADNKIDFFNDYQKYPFYDLIIKLQNEGINNYEYFYFNFGEKITKDKYYSATELITILKSQVPNTKGNNTYSNDKDAFRSVFPEIKTDIPCATKKVYEQFDPNQTLIWINISDNEISLSEGSDCYNEVIKYEKKLIPKTILDISFNGYVHLQVAIISADSGCTDSKSVNYSSSAYIDDGSCIYQPSNFKPYVSKNNSIIWDKPEGTSPFIYLYDGAPISSPFTPNKNGYYSIIAMNCLGADSATVQIQNITEIPKPILEVPEIETKQNSIVLYFMILFGLIGSIF